MYFAAQMSQTVVLCSLDVMAMYDRETGMSAESGTPKVKPDTEKNKKEIATSFLKK